MKPMFTAAIAGINYLLHPEVLGTIEEDINPDAVLPVTLLATEEIESPGLDDLLRKFEQYDDVYSSQFAFALVEKPGANDTRRGISSRGASVAGKQTYTVQITKSASDAGPQGSHLSKLPSGPYILHGKELHQAYRIYQDELEAFTVGIVPQKHDNFDLFLHLGETLANETYKPIAVPSRLYFPAPSIKKPLSGIRYSIPEGFDVGGLHTTLSSKNWTSLFPDAASKNADYVRLLLDQGAVPVGKTRNGQFAAGSEWTDTAAPVNPRADGKQPPGGAGAGAASALANYTWLANSLSQGAFDGTLTQGASYGLFAFRTTSGTVSQNGIHTSSWKFQSVGISSRSLENVVHLIAPSFKLPWQATPQPKRILYPTDFQSLLSAKQQSLMEEFVAAVEKLLQVKAERVSLANVWKQNPPHEAGKQTLDEYLGTAAYDAFCYSFYHNYDSFRSSFKAKFGEEPYAEPRVQAQWFTGAQVDNQAVTKKLHAFTYWFNTNIASTAANSANKIALVIPVLNNNSGIPDQVKGLRPEMLAPLLGTPQMDAPFAQIPMDKDKNAYLPFSAGIIAAKGDDLMLVQMMKRVFDMADWRVHVDTGSLTYPVGSNSRNVDDHHQDPYPPTIAGTVVNAAKEMDDTEL